MTRGAIHGFRAAGCGVVFGFVVSVFRMPMIAPEMAVAPAGLAAALSEIKSAQFFAPDATDLEVLAYNGAAALPGISDRDF